MIVLKATAKSRKMPIKIMHLIKAIFITSAFGAVPAALRLGPFSLSALITILIFVIALIVFASNPHIRKSSLPVSTPLTSFWILALGWFVLQPNLTDTAVQNYPIVWGGLLFVIIAVSGLAINSNDSPNKLDKLIRLSSYLYILVLGIVSFIQDQEPATTQVGVVFFSYHLARLINMGKFSSIFPLVAIIFLQAVLKSRIVVIAELIMLVAAALLARGRTRYHLRAMRYQRSIIFVLLVVSMLLIVISGIGEKTSGGDVALEIGGITINTSGRWYWWNVIFQSAIQSPWLGHGTAIPHEMLGIAGWSHPHNDYLRIFYQLGLFGLVFWVAFVVAAISIAAREWRQASNDQVRILCHMTVFGLLGISIMMLTDNTIVYSYVMFPIGALIGIVLSIRRVAYSRR